MNKENSDDMCTKSSKNRKSSSRIIFLRGVVVGCLILFAFTMGKRFWLVGERCSTHIRQLSVIRELNRKFVDQGKELPPDLSDLVDSQDQYMAAVTKNMAYCPEAWNEPGRIVLMTVLGDSYVVTLGDGTRAILSQWSNDARDGKLDNLSGKGADPTLLELLWFLFLILMLIVLYVMQNMKGGQPKTTD